ncbi:AtaL-like protein [Acidovorax sp.]|uniref:AtaL-like protein n=1 Tax=Acidovorax sp. TaxID=1872122 RepID=UPI003D06453E
MIYSTATVSVNPQGEVPLTRAQAWAGLVLKARDARLFLPPNLCTHCEVVQDSGTHIVREATIAGQDVREIIAFAPLSKVTFFQASGPREGAIVNELFEDEHGQLQLRFYGYLGLRGKQPGGPEEQAEQAWMDGDKGYRSALLSTLQRTRELLAQGQLPVGVA